MQRYSSLKTNTPLRAKKAWNPVRKPWGSTKPLKARVGLKTKTTLKSHKPMRKVGKVGKANIAARKKIGELAEANKLTTCELGPVLLSYGINVCLYNFTLAPAHRHKRAWYKGDAEKLAAIEQWVCACVDCHDAIEHNAELTEAVFVKLRGKE